MDNFDIWDENNDLVKKEYLKSNYKEVVIDENKKSCFIFFSSNGLYYPNTQEEFRNKICRMDRYEWEKMAQNEHIRDKAGKFIFVRDIYKQWYVKGINFRICSVDKLAELLSTLTCGFEVICVGSSAGGYIATLIGVLIHAKRIINFSGQFFLNKGALIEKYANDIDKNKYYKLDKWIMESKVPIFYFLPTESPKDIQQYNAVKELHKVRVIKFKEKNHAATMFKSNMPYVIGLDNYEIEELFEKYKEDVANKFTFLFGTEGKIKGLLLLLKECYYAIVRRIKFLNRKNK